MGTSSEQDNSLLLFMITIIIEKQYLGPRSIRIEARGRVERAKSTRPTSSLESYYRTLTII